MTTEFKYKKLKQIYNPVAAKIREHTFYLDRIPSDPCLRLGSLQTDLLIQRIGQGCKNIEERGIFVTRNFGRFLNLIEIQHEEFAVAMLRYLTVRRYITRSNTSGTSRWLQHPEVPMWDLNLFPINSPHGYVNWTDPLWLPSQWDIVETCGTCGGTGTITETVSDGEGSRTETRTCGTCGGRLEYTQIINTQWQRLLPLVTYPETPTPEMVEDAEEQVIYRLPLTEKFSSSNESAQVIRTSSPLINKMHQTGEQLEYLHKLHQSEIEKLHGGYLYRADFQIASFRTIMIEFTNLGGSVGWFFVRRPEFYFPRLPLCWITVFTFALLPPLWIALFVFLWETSVKIFPFLVE
ncbi:hypothetical protein PI95_031335 [Hassallia byssoidea VB512170]|uniref:Uncharacterized protein n=1 Tax=Hassallia byssoidea VB512170 TaxID=1304833 RepID=A0A846HHQ6_9CYAN|nr:hypothetical protein [Hassalia byssoidea]NEU76872.1 hypothetical protein [Hassalia byssoidea VB512170]